MGMFDRLIKTEEHALENPDAPVSADNFLHIMAWGVPADFVIARMSFNIAAANGHKALYDERKDIAEWVTSEDISKAEAIAGVCKNSNYEKCGY